jgi:serine/threonine protein kinase
MTLAQWLERNPRLTLRQAVSIGAQLASALGFAHKKGIVHRDIKPGNIMLVGDAHTVKVTDFGICRIEGSEATQATRVGDVIGTPHYMSPEQVRGQPADSRTDVFSTGIGLSDTTGELPSPATRWCRSGWCQTDRARCGSGARRSGSMRRVIVGPEKGAGEALSAASRRARCAVCEGAGGTAMPGNGPCIPLGLKRR